MDNCDGHESEISLPRSRIELLPPHSEASATRPWTHCAQENTIRIFASTYRNRRHVA